MAARKRTNEGEQEGQEGQEGRASEAPLESSAGDADAGTELQGSASEYGGEASAEPEQVIEELTAQLAELEDRHLRLAAEFDNFRKRTLKERSQYADRAQAELAKQLLEALDDLSRVSDMSSADHNASAILEGVRLVEQKLLRALQQAGLERIEAVDRPFDPKIHEALVSVRTDDPEQDEIVSQEMAKGFLFKDMLLRPALVEVMKYEGDGGRGRAGGEPSDDS